MDLPRTSPYERLHVDVDGMSLPGYWFEAPIRAAAESWWRSSGFDGTTEETYLQYGPGAAARVWHLLLIAGPGQADTNRVYPGKPFVPDTERWITPWLDVAVHSSGRRPRANRAARHQLRRVFRVARRGGRSSGPRRRRELTDRRPPLVRDLVRRLRPRGGAHPRTTTSDSNDIDQIPDSEHSADSQGHGPHGHHTVRSGIIPADLPIPAGVLRGSGVGAAVPRSRWWATERDRTHWRSTSGSWRRRAVPRRRASSQRPHGADAHCQLSNLPLSNQVLYDWLDDTLPV